MLYMSSFLPLLLIFRGNMKNKVLEELSSMQISNVAGGSGYCICCNKKGRVEFSYMGCVGYCFEFGGVRVYGAGDYSHDCNG